MKEQEKKRLAQQWRNIAAKFFHVMVHGYSIERQGYYGLGARGLCFAASDNERFLGPEREDVPQRFNPGEAHGYHGYFWPIAGDPMKPVADYVEGAEQRMYAALFIAAMIEAGEFDGQ